MDWERIKGSMFELVSKYRYAFLFLLAGVLLITIPNTEKAQNISISQKESPIPEEENIEKALEEILGKMEGAGKVHVLLTHASGEEITYQTDEEIRTEENSRDIRRETIIVTNQDRAQSGLIQRIDPPVYLGAVILSQGAESAAVRLALVEAVKSATGLPANKITVLKMK